MGEAGQIQQAGERSSIKLEADRLLAGRRVLAQDRARSTRSPSSSPARLGFEAQNRSGFQPEERVVRDPAADRPQLGPRQPLPGAQGLHPERGVLLRRRPDRADPAQGEVHRGGPLRRGPEDLAALVLLRAHGPAAAELPGRDLAPEDPRHARPPQIGNQHDDRAVPPPATPGAPPRSLLLLALAAAPPAQAQFIPYFGKNKVKYDNFAWRVYKSPHFEVYYYPEFEQHLGAAHLLPGERLPEALLGPEARDPGARSRSSSTRPTPSSSRRTSSPSFVPEGVAGLRRARPRPHGAAHRRAPGPPAGPHPHELTHVFAFDLIPREPRPARHPALDRRGAGRLLPRALGPARPHDDPRRRGHRPGAEALAGASSRPSRGRLVYNMGHACFEFMEARYGKEGIRQFLYTLRKGILGGEHRGHLQAGLPQHARGVRRRGSTSG